MQCPKCGAANTPDQTACTICFAPLSDNKPSGPIGLQIPQIRPDVPREDEYMPVAGIPGIDNRPQIEQANYLVGNVPSASGGPAAAGDTRVSLTGEVLEIAPAAPRNVSIQGAQAPPGARPVGAAPRPVSRGSYARPASRESQSKSGSGVIVAIVLVLLLLGGGGAAGYWFWQKQRAPAIAAEKVLAAQKNKDWRTLYRMMEFPEQAKAQLNMAPGGAENGFAMVMDRMGRLFDTKDYKVGDVAIDGEKATVKVTVTSEVKVGGNTAPQTKTDDVKFKLVNGEWKVDVEALQQRGMALMRQGGSGSMPGIP